MWHSSYVVQTLRGYAGWWCNALRAPMPSFVHKCDCASHNIDLVDFGLTQSNSWSLGTLKALCHHPTYPLGFAQRIQCTCTDTLQWHMWRDCAGNTTTLFIKIKSILPQKNKIKMMQRRGNGENTFLNKK